MEQFIITNNEPRTIFLQQLVFNGQKVLANKYFSQYLDVVENNQELSNKDKLISAIYIERFISLFKIGRIK